MAKQLSLNFTFTTLEPTSFCTLEAASVATFGVPRLCESCKRFIDAVEMGNEAPKQSDGVATAFEFVFESRSDAVDFRRPPLYIQLSQLERIHALRTVSGEGDSTSVSTTVAALEDEYTDADLSYSWRRTG
jgi:hypothetical protein